MLTGIRPLDEDVRKVSPQKLIRQFVVDIPVELLIGWQADFELYDERSVNLLINQISDKFCLYQSPQFQKYCKLVGIYENLNLIFTVLTHGHKLGH